jgi:hypothetical protein
MNGGKEYPRETRRWLLKAPNPDGNLPILVAKAFQILGGKPAPSIIDAGHDLNALHMISLLDKGPQVSVNDVMVLVE